MEKDLIDGRQGRRDATSTWLAAAAVEFSTINAPFEFKDAVDFFGWVFPGNARFSGATFAGTAGFSSAKFKQMARFPNATFAGTALFNNAKFTGDAQFAEAIFEEATFAGTATFFDASFTGKARFGQANFQGFTTYHKAIFGAAADFPAILAKRSFVLAGATFHALPDFIQAHFAEAPRLDNSHFPPGSCWERIKASVERLFRVIRRGDEESAPARYRALKRLAIQGDDPERELQFFAGEITSARFATDWPLPLATATWKWLPSWVGKVPIVFWSPAAWSSALRFWGGVIYQVLSNFGSSLVLPVFWWLLLAAVSTAVYLGEHFAFADARANRAPQSIFAAPLDPAETAAVAWRGGQPCDARDSPRKMRTFLAPAVREETNAGSEAIRLALTNGSVILDGGAEAQRRMFGCLYGLEVGASGGAGIPIVPGAVSDWSRLQRVCSGLLIFLFGLAVRNMLRMK